jgi:hypothetical protein
MEGSIRFLENILFFGPYRSSESDEIILSSAHRHIALTMVSLKAGNCSSALCNTIIGSLVQRNCLLLCKLTMFSSPKTVFLCVAYKNFSYMDSKPLT